MPISMCVYLVFYFIYLISYILYVYLLKIIFNDYQYYEDDMLKKCSLIS